MLLINAYFNSKKFARRDCFVAGIHKYTHARVHVYVCMYVCMYIYIYI